MASKIQFAAGSLSGKQGTTTPLIPGEPFWLARTSDSDNKNSNFTRWDEGTLYIGRPSINISKTGESPVPIAGARSYLAAVYRGELTTQTDITADIFIHARVGDYYVFKNDAASGTFKTTDDFRKDDILLIYDIGTDNITDTTGEITDMTKICYKRLNLSGGYADDVYFTQNGHEDGTKWTDFVATNVQDALLELNYEKLTYIGEIGSTAQIPSVPTIGGVWLVTADDITFNTGNANASTFICDKGDFVYWKQAKNTDASTAYWVQIPSGYTNADEIDYYDKDRVDNGQRATFITSLHSTFDETHKTNFTNASSNVHSMMDFLMANKAELDEQGKVPLSQLHDTVLGALQFRGMWNPLNAEVDVTNTAQITTVDGKMTAATELYNALPGFKSYEDGDSLDTESDYTPAAGDYYIVQTQDTISNLQYTSGSSTLELNANDWIVFCDSNVEESTSAGTSTAATGFWTKIDNSDRLSAMQYRIDTVPGANFFVTVLDTSTTLTLVGSPKLQATGKIGLANSGNNTVSIVGQNLVDQLSPEYSKKSFYPRYANDEATIENGFIEDEVNEDGVENINNAQSTNVSIFHSNLHVGTLNEHRDQTCYGNITLLPHLNTTLDEAVYKKSLMTFEVSVDNTTRVVNLFAPDGTTEHGITEDSADVLTNIALPEHTSTLVGKLAGIEFETARITKSTTEGYIETSSIEEHMNDTTLATNAHDSVKNIVEFHSQVSTPIENTYEVWFGTYDSTSAKDYDNDDFNEDGSLASKLLARLTKNTSQTESNVYVMLPAASGTLFTQEDFIKLFTYDDDTYLAMFGDTTTLDGNGNKFNTLKKSPLRQINNALRTRLTTGKLTRSDSAKAIAATYADEYAASVDDGTYKPTTDATDSTTVEESDLLVGKFDENGNLTKARSVVATKALGVSNEANGTGLIVPQRTYSKDTAEQYFNPITGVATDPIDVVVEMPNESGVMITSNSLISGGVWSN